MVSTFCYTQDAVHVHPVLCLSRKMSVSDRTANASLRCAQMQSNAQLLSTDSIAVLLQGV